MLCPTGDEAHTPTAPLCICWLVSGHLHPPRSSTFPSSVQGTGTQEAAVGPRQAWSCRCDKSRRPAEQEGRGRHCQWREDRRLWLGTVVRPLRTLAQSDLRAPLAHIPPLCPQTAPHQFLPPSNAHPILGTSQCRAHSCPLTCWAWARGSCQTEAARVAGSRWSTEARPSTEMA